MWVWLLFTTFVDRAASAEVGFKSGFSKVGFVENYGLNRLLKERNLEQA